MRALASYCELAQGRHVTLLISEYATLYPLVINALTALSITAQGHRGSIMILLLLK